MSLPFLTPKPCDHCGQTEYRYLRLRELLYWVLYRLWTKNHQLFQECLRENCLLDSWWNDNERHMHIEQARKEAEERKNQEINIALSKLTVREKELLKLK